MTSPRCHGEVLEYDPQRGYGRIRDHQNQEYFVHFRDLIAIDSLQKGLKVRFDAVLHRKGNLARRVEVL